ncbi:ArsR/SmtB family transcription factor [Palaeococcus ferrophilus]|uniref:ArsR/SmtB family transcription factor n=1 Tax=Palaeococcus ferrophilus TaxID=83868 RepID=UPI00064E8B4E|nr:helix-turn-helix domain-containing protein [Palaeococcus ferrophilus]
MREVLIITEPEKVKLLSDQTRFRIVSLLRERPMSVGELAELLGKDRSTVHRHIKALEDAGFVEEIGREGIERLYTRTARLFLLKPFGEEEDIVAFRMHYLQVEAERLYNLLKKAGFDIRDREEFIELTREVLKNIEDLAREPLKRLEGVDLTEIELFHVLNILVFLESCELCEKARRARELLGIGELR